MGRWSHLDSDEDRLPFGMTRVGYDADTQIYTYRDSDGSYWEGAPGCQYGKLHRVRPAPRLPSVSIPEDIDGDEAPYILHDNDDDNNSDFDSADGDLNFEKEPHLAAPDKARLHTTSLQPAIVGSLNNFQNGDPDSFSLSGTTVVSMPYDQTTPPQSAHGLKRAGTLSRLARFLTSSSGTGTGTRPLSRRRATVAGEAAAVGQRQGRGAKVGRTATGGGQWPGSGAGAGAPGVRRKRATTFDEILGVQ